MNLKINLILNKKVKDKPLYENGMLIKRPLVPRFGERRYTVIRFKEEEWKKSEKRKNYISIDNYH